MSKTEHFDKIWSRAATPKYCDGWERTFGGKKAQGGVSAPKHRAAKTSPKGCDMASHAPPGVPGALGVLPKTMQALAGYLEREKAGG